MALFYVKGLPHLLSGGGVGAITAEDEDLAVCLIYENVFQ